MEGKLRHLLRTLWYWIHLRWIILRPIGWPIVTVLLAALLLKLPEFRVVLERLTGKKPDAIVQFFLFLCSLSLLQLVIWYSSHILLHSLFPFQRPWRRRYRVNVFERAAVRLRTWYPRVVALIPALCAVVAFSDLQRHFPEEQIWSVQLHAGVVGLVGLLVFAGTVCLPPGRFAAYKIRLPNLLVILPATSIAASIVLAISGQYFTTLGFAELVGAPAVVCLFLIVLTSVGSLAAFFLYRISGPSLATIVLVILVALGLIADRGWTDNHAVRTLADSGKHEHIEHERVLRRPTLEVYLHDWLAARAEHNLGTPEQPYPLIVAAAQGGGVRAAMWTAGTLGALQDLDEHFACHLFAVTGISGGSIGALVFAADLRSSYSKGLDCKSSATFTDDKGSPQLSPAPSGPAKDLRNRAIKLFSEDFLAPTLVGMLFPDLLQRFVPWPVFPDRQGYLERAFEAAWRKHRPKDTTVSLDQGFLAIVRPHGSDGLDGDTTVPALFLVAADVEAGRRWITSDVRIDRNLFVDAFDTLTARELLDGCQLPDQPSLELLKLPASTAAGLSARFPWISPPAMIDDGGLLKPNRRGRFEPEPESNERECDWSPAPAAGDSSKRHLLDGALTENSGALTAAEILQAIATWCGEPVDLNVFRCGYSVEDEKKVVKSCDGGENCVYVRLAALVLTNDQWRPTGDEIIRADPVVSFPELLDPVKALLASRTARGREAVDRLARLRMSKEDSFVLVHELSLEQCDYQPDEESLPTTWTLSERAGIIIDKRITEEIKEKPRPEQQNLCRARQPAEGNDSSSEDVNLTLDWLEQLFARRVTVNP